MFWLIACIWLIMWLPLYLIFKHYFDKREGKRQLAAVAYHENWVKNKMAEENIGRSIAEIYYRQEN